jgi:hypothetical protein
MPFEDDEIGISVKQLMMRTISMAGLPLCWMLVLGGCGRQVAQQPARPAQPSSPPKPALKQAPATPIAEKKEELGEPSWDPEWDVIVEKALSPEMLSPRVARGVRTFCPRFASMGEADKRAFWAYTFQALAGAEAGLKPTTNVRHTEPEVAIEDTVSKRTVRQEGLLQLTYMDAKRYGCDFNWKQDKPLAEKSPAKTILTPKNNLLCGVKILENQMLRQRKPLLSQSSYWVTLRPEQPSYLMFAKQMKNVPAVCRATIPRVEEARAKRPSSVPTAAAAMPAHVASVN